MVSISMLVNACPRLYELWDVERTLKILGEIGKMVTGPVGCLGPRSSSEGSAQGEILLSLESGGVPVPHVGWTVSGCLLSDAGCLLSDAELAQFWQPDLLGPAGVVSMNSPAL
jgi:hypothetical protein